MHSEKQNIGSHHIIRSRKVFLVSVATLVWIVAIVLLYLSIRPA